MKAVQKARQDKCVCYMQQYAVFKPNSYLNLVPICHSRNVRWRENSRKALATPRGIMNPNRPSSRAEARSCEFGHMLIISACAYNYEQILSIIGRANFVASTPQTTSFWEPCYVPLAKSMECFLHFTFLLHSTLLGLV